MSVYILRKRLIFHLAKITSEHLLLFCTFETRFLSQNASFLYLYLEESLFQYISHSQNCQLDLPEWTHHCIVCQEYHTPTLSFGFLLYNLHTWSIKTIHTSLLKWKGKMKALCLTSSSWVFLIFLNSKHSSFGCSWLIIWWLCWEMPSL